MPDDTITIADGRARCLWAAREPETTYHDTEWGFPIAGDTALFERVCLEGFQSGLSWRTILAKRENFRAAFHGFDFERIARFDDRDVGRLGDGRTTQHRAALPAPLRHGAALGPRRAPARDRVPGRRCADDLRGDGRRRIARLQQLDGG